VLRRAVSHLKKADPVMAGIIERVGPCRYRVRDDGTHFEALTSSIIYQQVSGAAAASIERKLQALFGGRKPLPAEILASSDERLREAGLSRQKIRYLRDLAAHAGNGVIPFDTLHELEDEEVIRHLTQVLGIGRWTAQMFLMFRLGRPDILPELDLGIRTAVKRAYRLRKEPDANRLHRIGAPWAPYRTVASWYLWRSLGGDAAI
jgi:DNA-3-methyladenine glycosylase II